MKASANRIIAVALATVFAGSQAAFAGGGRTEINNTVNNSKTINETTNILRPNTATSSSHAYGGTGGQGGAGGNGFGGQGGSTGPITNSMHNNIEAPMPMGVPGFGFVAPSGDCGTGGYLSLGVPYVGLGGGKASQDSECLTLRGATATLNAGVATGDKGLQAIGLRSIGKLYPKFEESTQDVTSNLTKECADKAASISAALLANPTLGCKGDKVTVQVPAPKK
ncbi:MAG: hypothetical protein HY370_03945 [Proteobacteria bacterium]|nr:hypothetical protein [Pseudomonadota bacterium]